MKKQSRIFGNLTSILGILALISIIYTILAVQIFKDLVFFDHVVSMPFEFAILIATLLILLFDVTSLGWVSHKIFVTKESTSLDTVALIWGILCLLTLIATKVMADEIAREYRLGWETLGEWIVLYVCFFVQFFYNILIFILLRQTVRSQRLLEKYTGQKVRP
jgi:hypothetical protein